MLWLVLILPIPALAGIEKTRGVPPSLTSRYQSPGSDSALWSCLDGSKSIPWSAVNDDYCDCSDGSDEPGTGACPNSLFYCVNEGHIGSLIPSTRVGDGLCEPECCDGSDEQLGLCPNICKEVGEAYEKQQEAERKTRRTGSKIRALYIAHAQKEKKRLEGQIASSEAEVAVREKEVARLRNAITDIADTAESLSEATMLHKKESRRPFHMLSFALREHKKQLERQKALGDILDALRIGYNPNYQDMAVLEAVRGWEALAGLPHINDVRTEEGSTDTAGAIVQQQEEKLEDGTCLLKSDYETLLIEHDKHIGAPAHGSLLFNLNAYIPDAFLPQYLAFRDTLVSWLETFGVAKGIDDEASSVNTSAARKAYHDAENTLISPEWYGLEGEWKKLDGMCLTKDTGEWVPRFCLFGEAKQKPNKGGSFQSLGKFTHWNNAPGIEPGSPEFYTKQHYERGSKCWNGPHRSVTVLMSCGTENALHTVAEPEKCEYQLTMTSPALCLPPNESEASEMSCRAMYYHSM
ncbi:endoplasmic reticulum protein [Fomitopsis serialis]|uniref:endoplasmic reticulum protein n=1 Tax=Fomitopsis serialis TaxID=139415 RepID=UPI002007CA3A|nr:endoplasmic reticulum protein [Neoantrodia serialis]KAH9938712.1 endoplasmic reticulum protein [Neoantrodia serialis]